MPDVFQEPCPLCSKPAPYEIVDAKQRKWFRCDTCKNFIISEHAEKHVASSPSLRKLLSQRSYPLPDDKLLHIFVSGLLSGVGDEQVKLEIEIELKSTWLRRST